MPSVLRRIASCTATCLLLQQAAVRDKHSLRLSSVAAALTGTALPACPTVPLFPLFRRAVSLCAASRTSWRRNSSARVVRMLGGRREEQRAKSPACARAQTQRCNNSGFTHHQPTQRLVGSY